MKIFSREEGDSWNKKSIFFQPPYWRDLSLRHNLEVMHIKRICVTILLEQA